MKTFVDATVLASVLLALAVAPRFLARPPESVRPEGRRIPPLVALSVVTATICLNQVLFTVYVLRVHGGDPSFIARYLPSGWFDLAEGNQALRWVARHWPAPSLLAPSVLRVQAFLELPFVLLSFATVLRWLDATVYRRVLRSPLLPLAALSYTAVFCAVEWDLRNPYTVDDIVIRCVAALVTPPLLAAMATRDGPAVHRDRPLTASGLILFVASLGAFGVLVLVAYDTVLLYNLGRLDDRAALALAAAAALAVFRRAAALLPPRPSAGAAVTFTGHALRRWLTYFFVPALAVRYGVTFGTPLLAATAGLSVAALAGAHAVRDTLTGGPPQGRTAQSLLLLGQLGCALFAGTAAAYVSVRWINDTYYEAGLLRAVAAFFGMSIAVCTLTDAAVARRLSRRP